MSRSRSRSTRVMAGAGTALGVLTACGVAVTRAGSARSGTGRRDRLRVEAGHDATVAEPRKHDLKVEG
ncbi:hypothetical protein [Streptomyces sp. WMMC940]|uniref:hypothetical protein n=1 Tax=Streptomyces sp. WMMC940 TaxID=3015153 RepID=UPI0022B6E15E|nr:hypothetical protein [Streptomyces sp. WMMC940]MCZ7458535.1 hypothetical protein [Streptomyces sp. WMMC940]